MSFHAPRPLHAWVARTEKLVQVAQNLNDGIAKELRQFEVCFSDLLLERIHTFMEYFRNPQTSTLRYTDFSVYKEISTLPNGANLQYTMMEGYF